MCCECFETETNREIKRGGEEGKWGGKKKKLARSSRNTTEVKRHRRKGKEYTDGRDCSVPFLFLFPLWLSPPSSRVSVTQRCHSPNLGGGVEGFLAPASCSWQGNARE